MPSARPPLAQSESKAKFFNRMGWSETAELPRRLYAMMKDEAVLGRKQMSDDPQALLPHLRGDPSIKPPYSNSQISETALHSTILRIYRSARPETKYYYAQGHDSDGIEEENWIIRWMLWHVFRYRDNRNKNRRTGSQSDSPPVESSTGDASQTANRGQAPAQQRGPNGYWDPVRCV